MATLLHAVNAVAEIIFMSKKAGKLIAPKYETQIKLAEIAKLVRSDSDALIMGDPSAFFDCKDERWVLIWSSYPKQDAQDDSGAEPVTASLFVAVSHTIDPLEDWTVYALEARPLLAPGYRFCDAGGKSFSALAPQVIDVGHALTSCAFRATSSHSFTRDSPGHCPTVHPPTCTAVLCAALHLTPTDQLLRRRHLHQHRCLLRLRSHGRRRAATHRNYVNPVCLLKGDHRELDSKLNYFYFSYLAKRCAFTRACIWSSKLAAVVVQAVCAARMIVQLLPCPHTNLPPHSCLLLLPPLPACLFVFVCLHSLPSQAALYDVDDPDAQIFAATYMGAMSWKSSIAYKEQALIRDDYRCVGDKLTHLCDLTQTKPLWLWQCSNSDSLRRTRKFFQLIRIWSGLKLLLVAAALGVHVVQVGKKGPRDYSLAVLFAACRTFNNLIAPARPQAPEDVSAAPLFVMKVRRAAFVVQAGGLGGRAWHCLAGSGNEWLQGEGGRFCPSSEQLRCS